MSRRSTAIRLLREEIVPLKAVISSDRNSQWPTAREEIAIFLRLIGVLAALLSAGLFYSAALA